MREKFSRWFFKYFYYSNILFGFCVVNLNHRERKVTQSIFMTLICLLWNFYFIFNYDDACKIGFGEVLNWEKAIGFTAKIELDINYIVVISITIIQLINVRKSIELFTKLFKLTEVEGFLYEPFNSIINCKIGIVAGFSELTIICLFSICLRDMSEQAKFFNLNPKRNSFLIVWILCIPVAIVSRLSDLIALCIDIVRQFVKFMNSEIDKSLKMTDDELALKIPQIQQMYELILKIIKLIECNFGVSILILQTYCLFIAINQVNQNSHDSSLNFKVK